ncbi:rho GDP-dissociation inhibitor 1-like [Momordica charantia]|uniref:Rho GDP-dissociation inhibitor 1-like n=1 Tax=Momordica charantia TaxID=3673 RepID=A0A6J1CUH4_MOMCH|nr:rho GDP-dissociation inhibitor 1-like [Momordica charantia]
MSAMVGSLSTKDVKFNPRDEEIDRTMNEREGEEEIVEEDEDDKLKPEREMDLGPQFSLKEQLEKDKDDESLRKWKEQLLGSVDLSAIGESKEAEVKVLRLTIKCAGRPDLVLPLPFTKTSKSSSLFALKEGSRYRLRFSFTVTENIVSGLKYTNTVWKTGVRVDHTKKMLGTFSPQKEPYVIEMEEETTPSGMLARGSYSARTKFVDDDGKCYLDVSYHFEIQKKWPTPSS